MYTVTKEFTFDYAHRLMLDYPSKCSNIHGHTAKVQITIVTDNFVEPENDILVNFVDLKEIIEEIKEQFDHKLVLNHNDIKLIEALGPLNTDLLIFNSNPTSEVFARVICLSAADKIVKFMINRKITPSKKMVIKVSFWETPTSFATYMENIENIMKIKMNCNHKGCKCKNNEKPDHKCKCKDKKKDKDPVNEYVKVSVVRTKNLVPVSEETARRMAERGMLLGTLKKKSEEKKESKPDSNNVKPLVNSILRNLLK